VKHDFLHIGLLSTYISLFIRSFKGAVAYFSGFLVSDGILVQSIRSCIGFAGGLIDTVPIWEYHTSMRMIAKKTLIAYWEKHPNVEQALRAWYD